jgi:hypothetical protein
MKCLGKIFLVYWGVGLVAGLLALFVDSTATAMSPIVNLVGAFVPFIGKAASVSAYPFALSVFFSILWLLFPIVVGVTLVYCPRHEILDPERVRSKRLLMFGMFTVLFPAFVFAGWYGPDPDNLMDTGTPWDRMQRAMVTSRIGLFLVGGTVMFGELLFVCWILLWLVYFPRIYLGFGRR